jgi:hypothetical protein
MSQAALLLPDWKRCTASAVVAKGTLSRWCGRGDRLDDEAAGNESLLRADFQWSGAALPCAALSRQFDCADAAGSNWLRADPAHVRADMATARMLACGELGLTVPECAEIARDLRPLFGDAGFEFEASQPNRWYLRAAAGSPLPDCASPDEAIGDDLKLHLPQGASGKRWRQLFNDSQIILHNHAVNERRMARGAVSVNSLWFWGAGALPDWVRSSLTGLFSNAIEIQALASLAGVAAQPLDAELFEQSLAQSAQGRNLIDLTGLRDDALETHWLQRVDRALRQRRIDSIDLLFASGERFRFRPANRLRFWRRTDALTRAC